jgi:SNF family Na+-dependent transporter
MGTETASKRTCLHQSFEGRLLAGLFLVSSVAAAVTYAIALSRNSAFVVREGISNNWGQALLLLFCLYFLTRVVCTAERVLFGSCALIAALILMVSIVPSLRDLPGVFWRIVLLILACVAAASAGSIVINRGRRGVS